LIFPVTQQKTRGTPGDMLHSGGVCIVTLQGGKAFCNTPGRTSSALPGGWRSQHLGGCV